MKHLGDITKIDGGAVPVVDIITGGSPCQDLSVAGKRAGLAGERSGLFMDQIRVIKEMRENDRRNGRPDDDLRARWMVWENVPGALSSNGGEDFRAVLEETARVKDSSVSIPRPQGKWAKAGCIMGNGYSLAWRIHDAQYWGVPQRRRRICLLADFNGYTAPEILFESESWGETSAPDSDQAVMGSGTAPGREVPALGKGLHGDSEKSGKTGEEAARGTEDSAGDAIFIEMQSTKNTIIRGGPSLTLTARMGTGGNQVNAVYAPEVAHALRNGANCRYREDSETYVAMSVGNGQLNNMGMAEVSNALDTMHDAQAILEVSAVDCRNATEDEINSSLQASSNHNLNSNNVVREQYMVRRLTPTECLRLQGFPDDWLSIGEWVDSKGKVHKESDSVKYKAVGNSIALPAWEHLARRIADRAGTGATMASLFDGICGFPLVFSRAGIKPVWSSEIEEYCVAVAKWHYPEDEEQ